MINGLEEISYTCSPEAKRNIYRKLTILFMALAHNVDRSAEHNTDMTPREEERERLLLYNADLTLNRPDANIDEILEYADTIIKRH